MSRRPTLGVLCALAAFAGTGAAADRAVALVGPSAPASASAPAPASAPYANPLRHGTVIAVHRDRHQVEVVTRSVVTTYRYRGALAHVAFGRRISFRVTAGRLTLVGRRAPVRSVTFDGVVTRLHIRTVGVRIAQRLVITLMRRATPVVRAGERVLVTEKRGARYTLRRAPAVGSPGTGTSGTPSPGGSGAGLPAAGSGPGSGGGPGTGTPGTPSGAGSSVPTSPGADDASATGTVTQIGTSALDLQLSDGTSFEGQLPSDTATFLTQAKEVEPCETMDIRYHAGGGGFVLDAFLPTGVSLSASVSIGGGNTCATNPDADGYDDVVGTLTGVAPDESSLTLSIPGQGSTTFPMDPDDGLTDGYDIGSIIDVTYDPTNGNMANDVDMAELFTTGKVLGVSHELEVTNTLTGAQQFFTQNSATFNQVAINDQVAVTYWDNGGTLEADHVSDLSNGAAN